MRLCLPLAFRVVLAAAALLTGACSHYQLGAPGGVAAHRIFVAPVENRAALPQFTVPVGAQIRAELARDGRVVLANHADSADAVLHVTLRRYERDIAAARPDDTGLARKFAATLSVEISLIAADGRALIDKREIRVTRDVFLDSGLQPAEYQTVPLFAEALGREVVHAVLDTW